MKKFLLFLLAMMLTTSVTWGQTSSTTRWIGHDPAELISAAGTDVLLYNVGTGRFIINGGDWGTQSRLFYENTGKKMTLKYGTGGTNVIFHTGTTTDGTVALGANVPLVTSDWNWGLETETYTILTDGQDKIGFGSEKGNYRDMKFTRVDTGDGTYTYYIHEEFGGTTTTTTYYTISATVSGTTYYLKDDGTTTTNAAEAARWMTDSYGVYCTKNGTKYYIKYSNGSINVASGTSGNRASRSSSNYITYSSGWTTYYLRYANGAISFGANTSNRFTTTGHTETSTSGNTSYFWGAAYGENHGSHDGDANGTMVLLSSSYDKATWSTQTPGNFKVAYDSGQTLPDNITNGDTEVPIFNIDTKVSLDQLYQWRIVTIEDVLATVTDEQEVTDGLATNLTYLINDRGFERNDWSFYDTTDGWVPTQLSGFTYGNNGRYKYTWGFTGDSEAETKTQHRTQQGVSERWNRPLVLKSQYDSKSDAKFGFLEFEGVGSATTYITAPANGYYLITGYGFYQGSHPGYLYASTERPDTWTAADVESGTTLKQVTGFSKDSEAHVMAAGNDFVYNKDPYYVDIDQIYAKKGDRIYFGVAKTGATQTRGSNSYYYDSDWVCADQFQVYYLGEEHPVVFDEMETNIDYLKDNGNEKNYTNRTVRLKRTFTKGEWNSFVFPLDLTAVQIRNAFGNSARLAKLADFGEISRSNTCIDFVTVPLPAEGAALEAGQFYLIMPMADGVSSGTGEDSYIYYPMGSNFYFTTAGEDASLNGHTYASLSKDGGWAASGEWDPVVSEVVYDVASGLKDNGNRIQSYATYVSSGDEKNVPSGSYVLRKGDMYHTQSDMKIKGFRGWLREAATSNSVTIRINGFKTDIDPATIIESIEATDKAPTVNGIYDLTGRRIAADNVNALPKGLYIVNGKKIYVK